MKSHGGSLKGEGPREKSHGGSLMEEVPWRKSQGGSSMGKSQRGRSKVKIQGEFPWGFVTYRDITRACPEPHGAVRHARAWHPRPGAAGPLKCPDNPRRWRISRRFFRRGFVVSICLKNRHSRCLNIDQHIFVYEQFPQSSFHFRSECAPNASELMGFPNTCARVC